MWEWLITCSCGSGPSLVHVGVAYHFVGMLGTDCPKDGGPTTKKTCHCVLIKILILRWMCRRSLDPLFYGNQHKATPNHQALHVHVTVDIYMYMLCTCHVALIFDFFTLRRIRASSRNISNNFAVFFG